MFKVEKPFSWDFNPYEFGILDDSDGIVDYMSFEEVCVCYELGLTVEGFAKDDGCVLSDQMSHSMWYNYMCSKEGLRKIKSEFVRLKMCNEELKLRIRNAPYGTYLLCEQGTDRCKYGYFIPMYKCNLESDTYGCTFKAESGYVTKSGSGDSVDALAYSIQKQYNYICKHAVDIDVSNFGGIYKVYINYGSTESQQEESSHNIDMCVLAYNVPVHHIHLYCKFKTHVRLLTISQDYTLEVWLQTRAYEWDYNEVIYLPLPCDCFSSLDKWKSFNEEDVRMAKIEF